MPKFRVCVGRLGLGLAALTAPLALWAADPPATATEKPQAAPQAPPVIDVQDRAYERFVDLSLLGRAWAEQDPALMADVGLQLAEGERVLLRPHKAITAEKVLQLAAQLAAESRDKATLDRLTQAAVAMGNKGLSGQIAAAGKLAASSRDASAEVTFSAKEVEQGAAAAFSNYSTQIRAAKLAGDKEALEGLKKAIGETDALSDKQQQVLISMIDEAAEAAGEADPALAVLDKLAAPGRDYDEFGNYIEEQQYGVGYDPGYVDPAPGGDFGGGGGGGGTYTTIIVPPGGGGGGGGGSYYETAYSCNHMQVLMTPGGAVVQSYGRLGSIVFEPGDVIINIGGLGIGNGTSVDNGVNAGYVNGNRSVVVRNRNNGRVIRVYY